MAKFDVVKAVNEDAKVLDKSISNLAKRERNRQRELHVLGMGVVLHAIKHGDITLGRRLVAAIHGKDSESMTKWLVVWGPYQVGEYTITDAKSGKERKVKGLLYDAERQAALKKEAADRSAYIKAMNGESPSELDPPRPYEGFNFPAALKALIKRGETAKKKHPNDDKVDLTGMKEAKSVLASIQMEEEDEDEGIVDADVKH